MRRVHLVGGRWIKMGDGPGDENASASSQLATELSTIKVVTVECQQDMHIWMLFETRFGPGRACISLVARNLPVFLAAGPRGTQTNPLVAPVGKELCDGLNACALDRAPSQRRL